MTRNKRSRLRDSMKKGVASERKSHGAAGVEQKIPDKFLDAFGSISLENSVLFCGDSYGNSIKEGKGSATSSSLEDQTTLSRSSGNFDFSSSSSSNMSEAPVDTHDFVQDEIWKKNKPKMKKSVASSGMVSSFLGKDYVRSTPNKSSLKTKDEEAWKKEEAEQFLYSMIGNDTELSLAVVSDVYCQCGYNLDKAINALLELSSSSASCPSDCTRVADKPILKDIDSGSTYYSRDADFLGDIPFSGNILRNQTRWPMSRDCESSSLAENLESELPQKVLESLFSMPIPKTAERDPKTMNWSNVVKKITSFPKSGEPVDFDTEELSHAKGREYQELRRSASQHWDSMKSYYQKSKEAFSNGDKAYAAYLSEQGRLQKKMAREADQKCGQDIFSSRNKSVENVITIDLHGQHVKQAIKLLKLHLLFGACVRSVSSFRVITGCGAHGAGKSKLKNSVRNLLLIARGPLQHAWSEENQGCLLIRLGKRTSFSFLDSGSDTD